ncbi:ring-hydroxylating oxygenase subunit alpha [Novosphingobium marinum]|uniref:Phenylpropionate dioxygenase-like ring-hydroxylating dioxygenase large terminal subunit n=1 Tax=Novosphingobium marinum TaxID=1514948 RepID=A0A7Y9XTU5_9SPHN|nr:aromatic ring-hydroxylating dioxygenase subunit alpha [Novosphingobium marinum]NYH94481.1 phenylpropionate dioxygenase-like ring-hydroxylating dioxygenase large terminal subunit [Novosphingobium marinum]GGC22654.1 ring-hydroxylating oxygenase subunit alpha [Novosphingobium marinum]
MDVTFEQTLYEGMAAEKARTGPPEGFPRLPMIPAARYTDPDFLALEQKHLWQATWLYALHSDELPNPGDYRIWDRTGSPIVIVRGKDGDIRAFYNSCSHRGAPLVEKTEGTAQGFFCRYHGWTYDLQGNLNAVRELRDFPDFDKSCHGLKAVRCEMFGNWVFINEDPEAEPLSAFLGGIPHDWENLEVEKMRHIQSDSFEIGCQVKVLIDAFLETYHLKSIHPNTVDRFLDSRSSYMNLWTHGHSMMTTAHRNPDWRDPGAKGMPEIDGAEDIFEQNPSYNIFPNLVTPPSNTGMPILTFWPKTERTMIVDVHWFGPEGSEGHPMWPTRISNLGRILEEDTQFAPSIQRSVEAKGFAGLHLSYQERRIYHWHLELDRKIGDAMPAHLRLPDVLADYVEEH